MKKLFLLLGIIILLIVGSGIFLFVDNIKEKTIDKDTTVNNEDLCSTPLGSDTIVNNRDIDKCLCLDGKDAVSKCQNDIKNLDIYDQAIRETNVNLCEEITLENLMKNCIEIVESKINYIESKKFKEANSNNQ